MAEEQGSPAFQDVAIDYTDATAGFFQSEKGPKLDLADLVSVGYVDVTYPCTTGADVISGNVWHDGDIDDCFIVEGMPNLDVVNLQGVPASLTVKSVVGAVIEFNEIGLLTSLLAAGVINESIHVRFGIAPAVADAKYEDELYKIIDVDDNNDKITLDAVPSPTPSVSDKALITRRFLDNYIEPNRTHHLAEESPGGSNIPKDGSLRIIVRRANNAGAMKVRFNLAGLYGRIV